MLTTQRRQFTRYDINLATTMSMDGASFVQCLIRDVCAGGLFIALQPYKGIDALSIQQQILVHFSMKLNHDDRNFSLHVKIVHIDSNGIGVAFNGDSEFFFNALAKEAQTNSVEVDKPILPNSLSKQKRLEANLTSLSKEVLPLIIDNFFKHAEQEIQQVTKVADNYHSQVTLLDTFTNIKISKNRLFEDFNNLSYQINLLAPSLVIDQFSVAPKKSQLSLVEKNDFEDWLNLLPIIRNLETLFESRLNVIHQQMAFILETDKDKVVNPFSPKKLCENFRDTLSKFEKNERGKKWLYSLYGEILTKQLPAIYNKIDTIFHNYKEQKKTKTPTPNSKEIPKIEKEISDHLDHSLPLSPASTKTYPSNKSISN